MPSQNSFWFHHRKHVDNPEIHVGKNRIVRRIFEHLGYQVEKLDRVMFGNLTKKDLTRGKWRHLTKRELNEMHQLLADSSKTYEDVG